MSYEIQIEASRNDKLPIRAIGVGRTRSTFEVLEVVEATDRNHAIWMIRKVCPQLKKARVTG